MDTDAQTGDGGLVSLIDVLAVPGVGGNVLSYLPRASKVAIRMTCSATCALVDQHINTVTFPSIKQEDVLVAERLARNGVMPKQLELGAYRHSSYAAMTALFATVPNHFFARLHRLVWSGPLSEGTLQAVGKALPLLQDLAIFQGHDGHNIKQLAVTPLPSLRSLYIRRMDLSNAQFLTCYTQLSKLSLGYMSEMKGASALAELTGLTSLSLYPMPSAEIWGRPLQQPCQFPPEQQSELGSVLAALKALRSLGLTCLPPGPMTDAVSQLTALNELTLLHQNVVGNPGPIVLPRALSLCFSHCTVTPQHLARISAPQLQYLSAKIALNPDDSFNGIVKELCRGVLKAASTLYLDLQPRVHWSREDTAALMAVLHQSWQPSPQALCRAEQCSVELQQTMSSLGLACACSNTQGWGVDLVRARCSRQCLSLVPNGLSFLHLMYCTLDVDSLDPLAHVASLRELVLRYCDGITVASVERLLSTSVQGCLLLVDVTATPAQLPAEACLEMRARVVAKQGSRDTPVLQTAV